MIQGHKLETLRVIQDALKVEGVESMLLDIGLLSINRTKAHNSFLGRGLHEWELIDALFTVAKSAVDQKIYYVTWSGKTDDDWFLDTVSR